MGRKVDVRFVVYSQRDGSPCKLVFKTDCRIQTDRKIGIMVFAQVQHTDIQTTTGIEAEARSQRNMILINGRQHHTFATEVITELRLNGAPFTQKMFKSESHIGTEIHSDRRIVLLCLS